LDWLSKSELHARVLRAVHTEILLLRAIAPAFFNREAIKKTRADAREIKKSIDQVKRKLSAKMLSPELRLRLGLDGSLIGSPSDIANMPVHRLLNGIEEVRALCQAADDNQPSSDEVKRLCVMRGIKLILDHSLERPSAGSPNSAFCTISGLLYRSLTGKRQQLRRICQEVLRPYQKLLPR
jgi:hypothetical protein